MPLPTPNLDDLRFQRDLVDEARRRIIRYCPEWTEYNLSDPGITLIELFAWMTELMVYRLNRVPDKNYIKFLELLGVHLRPASSARTELTFYLSTPFPISAEDDTMALVPQGTEVTTLRTEEEREVIFTTDERLVIMAPRLTQLRRESDFHRNCLGRLGIEIFHPFNQEKPQQGDTFYLGFDETRNISGHILQLSFTCERTQAVGVRREDPPLVWECSLGEGHWAEIAPSTRTNEKDTTGGLNNPQGRLVLYLPVTARPDDVHGRLAYWVRCRLEQRRPEQGMYTESPRVVSVVAHSLGAATPATHAVIVRDEVLGTSNGEPGQFFRLANAPVLGLRPGEYVEVEEKREGDVAFVPWELVSDFSVSDRFARHFALDGATGELAFGPAIRQADGSVCQYGRVPEAGRKVRFSQYRHGGGVTGNVPIGKIQVLKSAIPYIDHVTNLIRAEGGRDQESLEEAKVRAARELRAQQRAVTADDYENLTRQASRRVARVKCLTPGTAGGTLPPGMIELLIVPAAADAVRAGDFSKLEVDPDLRRTVEEYLDGYRVLTTSLRIREPKYVGIQVWVQIVRADYSRPETVQAALIEALKNTITPLPMTDASPLGDSQWEGWPFGRSLYVAELYSVVQRVPGVKHVLDVKLSQRPLIPNQEAPGRSDEAAEAETELAPVTERVLTLAHDTLLCSLDHQVEFVEL